ncbi:hypothetical protein DERF_002176 [Dermatophagoides farinae]|uniref:Uncharacterized protein n=1 Tax=Dermatophagoides farinae TaxID=6954 RepID=A0A922IBX8_DERFA|nr:hypothetical protein DERF_002176 [Dermatophagoides farinae]
MIEIVTINDLDYYKFFSVIIFIEKEREIHLNSEYPSRFIILSLIFSRFYSRKIYQVLLEFRIFNEEWKEIEKNDEYKQP